MDSKGDIALWFNSILQLCGFINTLIRLSPEIDIITLLKDLT